MVSRWKGLLVLPFFEQKTLTILVLYPTVLAGRSVEPYHETLMAKIPINYLIQEAQKNQDLYGGLFSSLLR